MTSPSALKSSGTPAVVHDVLIVDDDEHVRSRLRLLLEQAGYTTHSASSAEEALARLRETSIPIVLTDHVMPGMSGMDLSRAIRSEPALAQTYVIMLSVRDSDSELVDGVKAGVNAYLSKRAPAAELLACLRDALTAIAPLKRPAR
jgi:DNA-binding response OmpR family regulator